MKKILYIDMDGTIDELVMKVKEMLTKFNFI